MRPVMKGTITPIGAMRDGDTSVDVSYIKMAYWPDAYQDLSLKFTNSWVARNVTDANARRRVIDYIYKQDEDAKCEIDDTYVQYKDWTPYAGKCPFPHRRTKDQSFTRDEYRAWRNLGWLIVATHSGEIAEFASQGAPTRA